MTIDRTRSTTQSTYIRIGVIIALGLAARLIVAIILGDTTPSWNFEYEDIAKNLVEHGAYAYSFYGMTEPRPTSFIPPVYPLFLAALSMLPVSRDLLVQTVQIAGSGFLVISTYGLAHEAGCTRRQSLLAAFMMAVYPPAVAYAVSVSTVTFEMLFVTTGSWLVLRTATTRSLPAAVSAGVCFALAGLTRSPWLTAIPLAALWLVWYGTRHFKEIRPHATAAGIVILAAVIVVTPWVAYNYTTHGQIFVTSTNGGLNFWIGNNPQADGEYTFPTRINKELVESVADWPEVRRDQFFYRQGFAFVRESPRQFVALFARKFFYHLLFRPNIGSNYAGASVPLDLARIGFIGSWLLLLPFAVVGLTRIWAGSMRDRHVLLIILFLSQAVLAALYFAGTRFRTPTDGFVIVWAAIGVTALFDTVSSTS